jgi:hypothetical protein
VLVKGGGSFVDRAATVLVSRELAVRVDSARRVPLGRFPAFFGTLPLPGFGESPTTASVS